jgi:putative membrane protein
MSSMTKTAESMPATPSLSFDPVRAGRAVILSAWTIFFAWLYLSGEMTRYLGPRTYWVVPFGAIGLGLAAVAHLATLRTRHSRQLSWGQVGALLVFLLPMLAVLAVPRPDLGALAASRKSQAGGIAAGVAQPEPVAGTEIRFLEISYSEESEEYANAVGAIDGKEVNLLGFVSEDRDGPQGTIGLARFYVSCCAADAIPYTVSIDTSQSGAGDYEQDAWLDVTGTLERRGEDLVVVATSIERKEEPDDPYLY